MRRSYQKMGRTDPMALVRGRFPLRVVLSYVLDWVAIIFVGAVATVLSMIEPNKRPFSLVDPNLSHPFTEHETVPSWLLLVCNAGIPIVVIAVVALVFVPGTTVPANTPASLVWRRKLWELHVGLLGLALSLCSAWWFTQGMKNLFGKPRPDLIARCEPDVANASKYVVGGILQGSMNGQLYSADICKQTDSHKLDDGWRSYPSGHASSAAAGLTYLSLFLAGKFSVTFPFVLPSGSNAGPLTHAAFPSRVKAAGEGYEASRSTGWENRSRASSPANNGGKHDESRFERQNSKIQSLRNQAAAPPLYLLFLTFIPFCLAIFISASRWYDFRHHGFDILFGFLMGFVTAVYAFRYYHLPIQEGAGWAWGPRSRDRAFWAGVGRLGYSGDDVEPELPRRWTDTTTGGATDFGAGAADLTHRQPTAYGIDADDRQHMPYTGGGASGIPQRPPSPYRGQEGSPFQDVEMQRI